MLKRRGRAGQRVFVLPPYACAVSVDVRLCIHLHVCECVVCVVCGVLNVCVCGGANLRNPWSAGVGGIRWMCQIKSVEVQCRLMLPQAVRAHMTSIALNLL